MKPYMRVKEVIGHYGEDQFSDMVYFTHQIWSLHPVPVHLVGPGRGRTEIQWIGDKSSWPSIAVWDTVDEILNAMIEDAK